MWAAYALVGVICFLIGFGVGFVVGGYYSLYAKMTVELVRMLREAMKE